MGILLNLGPHKHEEVGENSKAFQGSSMEMSVHSEKGTSTAPPPLKKNEKQIETLHFGKQEEFKDDGVMEVRGWPLLTVTPEASTSAPLRARGQIPGRRSALQKGEGRRKLCIF